MDHLHERLDALEQQMSTVTRRLRWWRGLAGGLLVLAVLTWALPAGTAQSDPPDGGEQGLAQRVAALETLLKHFSREGNEVFITGANLHLVNGLGSTDCTDEEGGEIRNCPNGLVNLIVGYNEPRPPVFGEPIRTGSHNVVVGQEHNFSRFGGLVVGRFNSIRGDFSSVSGGEGNTASGVSSSVSGGGVNVLSPVGGGNTASGDFASVSGGRTNSAEGENSSVSGGENNAAASPFASVSGGQFNTANAEHSSVCGGGENTASGPGAAVSGGFRNTANGFLSAVSGGEDNIASGSPSSVQLVRIKYPNVKLPGQALQP